MPYAVDHVLLPVSAAPVVSPDELHTDVKLATGAATPLVTTAATLSLEKVAAAAAAVASAILHPVEPSAVVVPTASGVSSALRAEGGCLPTRWTGNPADYNLTKCVPLSRCIRSYPISLRSNSSGSVCRLRCRYPLSMICRPSGYNSKPTHHLHSICAKYSHMTWAISENTTCRVHTTSAVLTLTDMQLHPPESRRLIWIW